MELIQSTRVTYSKVLRGRDKDKNMCMVGLYLGDNDYHIGKDVLSHSRILKHKNIAREDK